MSATRTQTGLLDEGIKGMSDLLRTGFYYARVRLLVEKEPKTRHVTDDACGSGS